MCLYYDRSYRCFIWFLSQITPSKKCPNSFVLVSAQTRSIMSLFCLVFVIDGTQFIQSGQLNFIFNVDHFYTISHVVVLSSIHHSRLPMRSIMKVKYCFQRRLHLYNQSCRCPICFSSQMALGLSVTTTQFLFLHRPYLCNWSHQCLIWFMSQTTPDQIGQNQNKSFFYKKKYELISCMEVIDVHMLWHFGIILAIFRDFSQFFISPHSQPSLPQAHSQLSLTSLLSLQPGQKG